MDIFFTVYDYDLYIKYLIEDNIPYFFEQLISGSEIQVIFFPLFKKFKDKDIVCQ